MAVIAVPATSDAYLTPSSLVSNVITSDVPVIDGCPVLTRLKLFVSPLGTVPTIEHVFRNKRGEAINLGGLFPDSDNSEPAPEADSTLAQLRLRSREVMDTGDPVFEVAGQLQDAANGVVRFTLLPQQVAEAGVYQLSISVQDPSGNRVLVDNPMLLVEKSLFSLDNSNPGGQLGPPSLQQIREQLMDSSPAENLLLDRVEYSDDQIAYALSRPVYLWNNTPPPLRPSFNTRNFPFPNEWMDAICGHLLVIAANNFRRNKLEYAAGGMSINDLAKEPEYGRAGQALLEQYKQFVQYKKVEINQQLFCGEVHSIYGGLFR
jgi:hypothetical protein